MEMIRIAEMLTIMNTWEKRGERVPFSITWVKCDEKQGTGGEKITLDQAVLVGNAHSKSEKRNPNHFENYTRNIRAYEGDRIMKIHIPLVTRFNGKQVIL